MLYLSGVKMASRSVGEELERCTERKYGVDFVDRDAFAEFDVLVVKLVHSGVEVIMKGSQTA